MRKYLVDRLNDSIFDVGSGFGPALVRLLLYGPGKEMVFSSSRDSLKEAESNIEQTYLAVIVPKLERIVSSLTNNQARYPKKDLPAQLTVKPFEAVQRVLRKKYASLSSKEQKLLGLDETTVSALNNPERVFSPNVS